MLSGLKNKELYSEWVGYIERDDVRRAFQYIVGLAACSKRYDCRIQWKGEVRDFRFYDHAGSQPLSFITNKKWLLFYFRKPAVESGDFSKHVLSEAFDSFNENSYGEWTIKLKSIAEIDHLIAIIE